MREVSFKKKKDTYLKDQLTVFSNNDTTKASILNKTNPNNDDIEEAPASILNKST
ncbi:30418_t:CDS:2 [Gigaspora margarita]|uniref:30418_t:CDS:1 n=1 Tax=Gigaspora margarita TaxID=4874 RepID=A0ABN7WAZ6_GIGMA|nr:30418_t:CDS:2 [Gigaspora margarita]